MNPFMSLWFATMLSDKPDTSVKIVETSTQTVFTFENIYICLVSLTVYLAFNKSISSAVKNILNWTTDPVGFVLTMGMIFCCAKTFI